MGQNLTVVQWNLVAAVCPRVDLDINVEMVVTSTCTQQAHHPLILMVVRNNLLTVTSSNVCYTASGFALYYLILWYHDNHIKLPQCNSRITELVHWSEHIPLSYDHENCIPIQF